MTIETLGDWNTVLGYCGCCEMPTCPTPELECESLSGSATVDGYAGFTAPAGAPEDDLPNIYETLTAFAGERYTGTGSSIISGEFPGGESQEWGATVTYNWSTIFGEEQSEVGDVTTNQWDPVTETCNSFSGGPTPGNFQGIGDVTYTEVGSTSTCEVTERSESINYTSEQIADTDLQGCPGPFPERDAAAWSYQLAVVDGDKLEDAVTKADLMTDAQDEMPEEWPNPPTSDSCSAAFESTWPTIGDIGEWPACDDGPPVASASVTLTKTRFRWVIPDTFEGSYFKVTWDILEEPDGWDATIDDPDYEPPVPNDPPEPIPQVPDPDAPDRSFVSQDNTWEWAGPGTADPDSWKSSWYEIDPPTVPGTRRVVNIRYECYRSPYGNKPQVTGEGVTLPDP